MKVIELLGSVEIFGRLSREELQKLAALVEERQMPSGAVLFRQGEAGDALYILLSGRVKSFTTDSAGRETLLGYFSEGQSLGEMALLMGESRPATVQAVTEVKLLVLRKIAFDIFLAGNLQMMLEMMRTVTERQASANQAPAKAAGIPIPAKVAVGQSLPPSDRQPQPAREQKTEPVYVDVPFSVRPQQTPQPYTPVQATVHPVEPAPAQESGPTIIYAQPPTGKVFTVFSPKGGVGKSMVAVNLAVALARMYPDSVALVDLSLTFSHDMLFLNMVAKSSLATTNADALRKMNLSNGLDYYFIIHPSTGLRVMAGSRRPEEGEMVSGETAKAAIEQLRRHFQFVVVDTGSCFSDPVLAALEASDRLLMLCSPEISTLRDIRESQRIVSNVIHIPKDRVLYLMNHIFPFKALSREQFEGALQQEIYAELPHGGDVPIKAALKGEALVESQRSSPIAKAIERLAVQLSAEGAKVGAGHDGHNDKKRGFFR